MVGPSDPRSTDAISDGTDPLPRGTLDDIHEKALHHGLTELRTLLIPDAAVRERIESQTNPSAQLRADLEVLWRDALPDGRRPLLATWLEAAAMQTKGFGVSAEFAAWAERARQPWRTPATQPLRPAPGGSTPRPTPAAGTSTTVARIAQVTASRDALRAAGAEPEVVKALTTELLSLKREQLHPRHPRVGLVLSSRWVLLAKAGRGGFAEVWRAHDQHTGEMVAVKLLHSQFDDSAERRARFFRGARQMAELTHPHVVRVIAPRCVDQGFHFFVMEWLAGGDLKQAVLGGGLGAERRVEVICQVAGALSAAHAKGLVHRDVKPANILLTADGQAKLTDFDLVRVGDSTGGTRTGALGTFIYAAPEVMKAANRAQPTADVYGLGMTALFVWRGLELGYEVLVSRQQVLASLPAPEAVRATCAQAIAIEAGDRFESVAAFAAALRAAGSGRQGAVSPAERAVPPLPASESRAPVDGSDRRAGPRVPTDESTPAWPHVAPNGSTPARPPAPTGETPTARPLIPSEERPMARSQAPTDESRTAPPQAPTDESTSAQPSAPTRARAAARSRVSSGENISAQRRPAPQPRPSAGPRGAGPDDRRATGPVEPTHVSGSTDQQPGRVMAAATRYRPAMVHIPVEPERVFKVGERQQTRLTRPYWMAATPVTQGQYWAVMGENPAHFKSGGRAAARPVEMVTWFDAVAYCCALSRAEGLPEAYDVRAEQVRLRAGTTGYRLPTEAEWEHACRAGTKTRYWSGDSDEDLERVGWHKTNSDGTTHPVALKPANPWGLFDVHGNVWEWCGDYSDRLRDLSDGAPLVDPAGPASGGDRVVRGGSYADLSKWVRSAARHLKHPTSPRHFLGFRVVRTPEHHRS